jgi:SAM-dependent methyltransferase
VRDWARALLHCLACSSASLEASPAGVLCSACGHSYPERDDVVDFLYRPHPTIVREREAVHRLDREGQTVTDHARSVLQRLDADLLTEEELAQSTYLRTITESRAQILELLRKEPLTHGATVLEIGADTGWASSVLLEAGCRVIATEITDHLFLAAQGNSPNLCRLQADMNQVPLNDSSVDVVFAASCVHHSWDLARTFREVARVLKPGGTAYLCGEPMPSVIRFVVGGRFGHEERKLGINETWISRARWLRQCRMAGLEPRILFPSLSEAQLSARLAKRHVPRFVAASLRPFLPIFQVSAHLRADKAAKSL